MTQPPFHLNWASDIEGFKNVMTWGRGSSHEPYWAEEEAWLKTYFKDKNIDETLATCCGLFRELETLRTITHTHVTGLDFEPNFIDHLKDEIVKSDYKNPAVSVDQGSILELPYDDQSFDLTTCLFNSLPMMPDPQKSIQEILRVTKAGGYAVISVWKETQNVTEFRMTAYRGAHKERVTTIEYNEEKGLDEIIVRAGKNHIHASLIMTKDYVRKVTKTFAPNSKIKTVDLEYCSLIVVQL